MQDNTTSALQLFEYEGNELRTMIGENGEIYFVVSDVCKFLGIVNIGNAINRLDRDGIRQADVTDSSGRVQSTSIANEPNLYRLIFRSDKPNARKIQHWVKRRYPYYGHRR